MIRMDIPCTEKKGIKCLMLSQILGKKINFYAITIQKGKRVDDPIDGHDSDCATAKGGVKCIVTNVAKWEI